MESLNTGAGMDWHLFLSFTNILLTVALAAAGWFIGIGRMREQLRTLWGSYQDWVKRDLRSHIDQMWEERKEISKDIECLKADLSKMREERAAAMTGIQKDIERMTADLKRVEAKVDSILSHLATSGAVTGVHKGILEKNSPLQITEKGRRALAPLAEELGKFWRETGYQLKEHDLVLRISNIFGERIIQRIKEIEGVKEVSTAAHMTYILGAVILAKEQGGNVEAGIGESLFDVKLPDPTPPKDEEEKQ